MSDVHDTRRLNRLKYRMTDVLGKCDLEVGDRIEITSYTDNGRLIESRDATVAGVFERHVLLDFGQYKESRLIVNICLGCSSNEFYKKL